MIVTTAGRTDEAWIEKAKAVANHLQVPYIPRRKQSIQKMIGKHAEEILVIGKERFELYDTSGEKPFFFHPNLATVRMKRIQNGEKDPLIETCNLHPGMSFLDCTLGLASDSIVASYVTGEQGKVHGIEVHPFLAYLVGIGLKSWNCEEEIKRAMARIQIFNEHHLEFLKKQTDDRYDVVYFDPMFEQTIEESLGIQSLTKFAFYDSITQEVVDEALRVAKHRVVLKDHFRSNRFSQFGFHQIIRKTSKFHYGYIEKRPEQASF
ncbi:class I SAM-dependent methyltransferase [Peribacillus tepidiphilus]|uniref:class I SAM-dependent methyltransferase n=1 Tax=Peribacillus tepidiphilus TaxID=2652445 RepID=UPI0035B54773